MTQIHIQPATGDEAEAIARLLREVQDWLHACGLEQWRKPFTVKWIRAEIDKADFHTVRQAGNLVAVFRLLRHDPVFWGGGSDENQSPALYLHTLAVSRAAAGQGIGRQILDWAAAKARRENLAHLRLDCLAGNGFLVGYYADFGFRFYARKQVKGCDYVLYQLPLKPQPPTT